MKESAQQVTFQVQKEKTVSIIFKIAHFPYAETGTNGDIWYLHILKWAYAVTFWVFINLNSVQSAVWHKIENDVAM